MINCPLLINQDNQPKPSSEICGLLKDFGGKYNDAVVEIIRKSQSLDERGEIFFECASRILKSFGMTRSGPFYYDLTGNLNACWAEIGKDLLDIRSSIEKSSISRDRFLIDSHGQEREKIISKIWCMTKDLLPITMGEQTYGLVGASKILFSVLPEIVLPVDNVQWKRLFKTVDLSDVIRFMADDIQKWEELTGEKFNHLDKARRITTLPSVYNVVAMAARPE